MFPAILVVEYTGYWEGEPENWVTIYVNGANVCYFSPCKFDNGKPTHYKMRIRGTNEGFIVLTQDLNLTSTKGEPSAMEIH